MAALEASLEDPRHAARRAGGRGPARRGADGGPAERSREELYEEAQRRGIPGRSRMSKEELADALQEAS